MKKIAIALLLGAVFAVGCGDKDGGAGSGSAKASNAPSSKPSGGTSAAAAGGGSTDDYVKAYCDCKQDAKCLADAGMKYADTLTKNPLNADQSKKIAECTTGMAMPSGMPSAAGSAAPK